MFKKATDLADELLGNGHEYPRVMITNFAKADSEVVRQMFRDLYDETTELSIRVEKFQAATEELRIKYNDDAWKKHYQSTSAVSTYLCLRFPDKYYVYRYEICRDVARAVESDWQPKRNGSVESMLGGYALYDEICRVIQDNIEICTMISDAVSKHTSCWPDKQLRTTMIDMGFYINKYYKDGSKPEDGNKRRFNSEREYSGYLENQPWRYFRRTSHYL